MGIPIVFTALAVFVLLLAIRISALVGRDGAVHTKVPGARQALAYRRRLERKLHAGG